METKGKKCGGLNTLGIGVGSIHDVTPKSKLINIRSITATFYLNLLCAEHQGECFT